MRRFFVDNSPLEIQRQGADSIAGMPGYWGKLADLELLGIGAFSRGDSSTTPLVDVFPLYLEMGRALAASPHLATAMIAVPVIGELDTAHMHSQIITDIVLGDRVVVPAVVEVQRSAPLGELESRAERTDEGWRLFGQKVFVQYANVASHILLPAQTAAGELTVFLVPVGDLVIAYMQNASHLPLFQVSLNGVEIADTCRVGETGSANAVVQASLDRAAVLRCVEVVGAGERVLEFCLDYASARKQFGVAIGSFQAVQYLCTDIAIATRVTFLLSMQCAAKIDHGEPYFHELAALRKYARRAAAIIVGRAQEVHAGVGFMDEHDLHLFTRRSLFWQSELGDDEVMADILTGVSNVDHAEVSNG
jgi:alkylation response protein AidB-like acyl-CoA dehydrogenase